MWFKHIANKYAIEKHVTCIKHTLKHFTKIKHASKHATLKVIAIHQHHQIANQLFLNITLELWFKDITCKYAIVLQHQNIWLIFHCHKE